MVLNGTGRTTPGAAKLQDPRARVPVSVAVDNASAACNLPLYTGRLVLYGDDLSEGHATARGDSNGRVRSQVRAPNAEGLRRASLHSMNGARETRTRTVCTDARWRRTSPGPTSTPPHAPGLRCRCGGTSPASYRACPTLPWRSTPRSLISWRLRAETILCAHAPGPLTPG